MSIFEDILGAAMFEQNGNRMFSPISQNINLRVTGQSLGGQLFSSQDSSSSVGIDTAKNTIQSLTGIFPDFSNNAVGGTYITSYSDTRDDTDAWYDGVNQELGAVGDTQFAIMDARTPVGGIVNIQYQADQNRVERDFTFDLWNEQVGSGIVTDNGDGTYTLTDDEVAASEYIREVITMEAGRVPSFSIYLKKGTYIDSNGDEQACTASPFIQISHGAFTNGVAVDPTDGSTRILSGDSGALTVTETTHSILGDCYLVELVSDGAVTSADYTVDYRFYPGRGTVGEGSIGLADSNVGSITVATASDWQDFAGSFSDNVTGKVSRTKLKEDGLRLFDIMHAQYGSNIILTPLGHRDGTVSATADAGQNLINAIQDEMIAERHFIKRGSEIYHGELTDGVHFTDAGNVAVAKGIGFSVSRHIFGAGVPDTGITVGQPSKSGDTLIIPTTPQAGTTYGSELSRTGGVADIVPSPSKTSFVRVFVDDVEITPTAEAHHDATAASNANSYVLTFGAGALGNDSNKVDVYAGYGAMYNLDTAKLVLDSNGLAVRTAHWQKPAGESAYIKVRGA